MRKLPAIILSVIALAITAVLAAAALGYVAPTGFHVTGTTATSVSVAWDAYTGGTVRRYQVRYAPTGSTTYTTLNGTTATSLTVSGLTSGTTYKFAVRAVLEPNGGTTDYSSEITATPGSTPTPTPTPTPTSTPSGCTTTVAAGGNIQTAVNNAAAGNVVCVRAGTFNQRVTVNKAITLKNYPGETVTLNEAGLATSATDAPVRLGSSATFDGFILTGSSGRGLQVDDGNGTTIKNVEVKNAYNQGILVTGDNITVKDSNVHDTNTQNTNGAKALGYWGGAISSWVKSNGARSTNLSYTNNTVQNNWGEGIIALHANGVTIDHDTVRDNWSVDIYVDNATNVDVTNNTVGSTNATHDSTRPPVGISMAVEDYTGDGITPQPLDDIVVADNVISRVSNGISYWQAGTKAGQYYKNVQVLRNQVSNKTFDGLSVEDVPSGITQPTGNFATNNTLGSWSIGDPAGWTLSGNS